MSKLHDSCEKVRLYPETSDGLRKYIDKQPVKPSLIKTANTAISEWLEKKLGRKAAKG